jgi:hypothetical protein
VGGIQAGPVADIQQQLNAVKSSLAISHTGMEFMSSVSALMMKAETVSKALDMNFMLTLLITWEYFMRIYSF